MPVSMPEDPIVKPAVWSTAFFVVGSVLAVASEGVAVLMLFFDGLMFLLGCVVFAFTLLRAAERSRTDELSVAGIWLLAGQRRDIQQWLLGCLGVQVAVALAAAAARPYTPVAFGVLVPTFGLGLCGLWAVRSGSFPPRAPGRTD